MLRIIILATLMTQSLELRTSDYSSLMAKDVMAIVHISALKTLFVLFLFILFLVYTPITCIYMLYTLFMCYYFYITC